MTSVAYERLKLICTAGDRDQPESDLIYQLESILSSCENMDVLNEQDEYGLTLLHEAVDHRRSVEFIKLLVTSDEGIESVRTADNGGMLSIHIACFHCNVEVVKYLYSIYPESINVADNDGDYPLHHVLYDTTSPSIAREDLTRFLLLHNQSVVYVPLESGRLALHIACKKRQPLEIVKLVYNAYPQAIHARNNRGRTPLNRASGIARHFLEYQLKWERKASKERHPDDFGRLPIHRLALTYDCFDVSVGTFKLVVHANPEGACARDNYGCIPLHYACRTGQLDVVKFLIDCNEGSYKEVTPRGDLPLHIACIEGHCSIINYILEKYDYGVSSRNKDGKLPIELLLDSHVDRDSLEYVEAINRLLRAHPGVLEGLVTNNRTLHVDGLSGDVLKRKHDSI